MISDPIGQILFKRWLSPEMCIFDIWKRNRVLNFLLFYILEISTHYLPCIFLLKEITHLLLKNLWHPKYMQDAKHMMKINEEHWNDVNSNSSCYKFDYAAAIFCITLRFGSRFYIGWGIHATAWWRRQGWVFTRSWTQRLLVLCATIQWCQSSVFGLKTNLAGFVKGPKMHYYESQKKLEVQLNETNMFSDVR